MMRWKLLAVGFGAYTVVLIVIVLAMLVDAGFERASNGRLWLAEV